MTELVLVQVHTLLPDIKIQGNGFGRWGLCNGNSNIKVEGEINFNK